MAQRPPNLLVLFSDQHHPDMTGALGAPVRTPNLDALSARGVTFTSAYCNNPLCTPARASFLTGKLTPQHGVWDLGAPVRTEDPTWAHVLARAGYHTVYVGREHFHGPDVVHGFERLAPKRICFTNPGSDTDWEAAPSPNSARMGTGYVRKSSPLSEPSRTQQVDTIRTELALDELDRLGRTCQDRPWALCLGFMLPHNPYQVDERWYDLYRDEDVPAPRTPPDGTPYEEHIPDLFAQQRGLWVVAPGIEGVRAEDITRARRCYFGMISCMDALIGRVLTRLDELGLAQNTWVLHLSDHGENLGEHGLWCKSNFFEESVRIPWIVAPPGYQRGGARCAEPISQVDWLPTMLEFAGVQGWDEALPGRSLLPLVGAPDTRWGDRPVIADYGWGGVDEPVRMVRWQRYCAWFGASAPPALYDLEADPHQWHDRAADPAYKDVLARLEGMARADGWDPAALRKEIVLRQRRMRFIKESAGKGHTYAGFVEGAAEHDPGTLARFAHRLKGRGD